MRINSRTGLAAVTLAMAVLPAVFLVPGATAARTETAGASTAVQLRLPQPTGHFVVGVRDESVSDPSRTDPTTLRPRRLPLRVWYPARSRSHAAPAPYVSAATQAFMEYELGLPTGVFDIDTHAFLDAPARHHVRGVVLVQPGGGSISAFQTGLITDLASHGYAVVSMDIPQESFIVFEADGTPIYQDESFPFDQWRLDARVVLDDLARLVPQARHRTPIGMFGHSRGGAATIDTMFHEPRVQAGVSLDTGVILFGNEVSSAQWRGRGGTRSATRTDVQPGRPLLFAEPRRLHLSVARSPSAEGARHPAQRIHRLRGVQRAGDLRRPGRRCDAGCLVADRDG